MKNSHRNQTPLKRSESSEDEDLDWQRTLDKIAANHARIARGNLLSPIMRLSADIWLVIFSLLDAHPMYLRVNRFLLHSVYNRKDFRWFVFDPDFFECDMQCGCPVPHVSLKECKGTFINFNKGEHAGKNCLCPICDGQCVPGGGEYGGCENCQLALDTCEWCDACHVLRGDGLGHKD